MIDIHKDTERDARHGLAALLTMRETRDILSCSTDVVIELIRDGHLTAYTLHGKPLSRDTIKSYMTGIRISPSSLQDYIESIQIR